MTHSRRGEVGAALAGCLGLIAASCRNDAGATKGQRADLPAANQPSSATTPGGPTVAPLTSSSASVQGSPAPSPSAQEKDDACGGPPTGPLPRLEERKLAAEQQGRYRFELKYPHFHEDDEKVTQKLNVQLVEQLTTIEKRFIKEAEGQGPGSDPDNARWFEGTCGAAYHSKSFVSVACDTMEGPGAHPNLDKFAYNFRICPDVRPLALADICRSLPECRKRIIALINEDFRAGEKKQTGIQFREGPGARGEATDLEHPVAALSSFGITPTGLRFFLFDELPHVLQAFAVIEISAAKLRPVLRDDMARRLWVP